MRLVLDTNILIAALIKDSLTREMFFAPGFEFLLPEYALGEVRRHHQKIARYASLTAHEVDLLLSLLLESVTVVPMERILPHLQEAEVMLRKVDEKDLIAKAGKEPPLTGKKPAAG